jgi:BirA family biotin operon repressor/biotin-[acetyl-CoA-carboxylase] ligase
MGRRTCGGSAVLSVRFVEETGSTNADLLAALATGDRVDGWLVARRQTAGRGRLNRVWSSRTGNFHGSTAVIVKAGDPAPHTLALVAGIAARDAVVDATRGSIRPVIKWPNDLLIDGAKLAGILLERQGDTVVVGIGVNLGWAPELADRPTVSLADLGMTSDVEGFAAVLDAAFAAELHRWRSTPLSATVLRWIERAHPAGTRLTISEGSDAGLTGAFQSLDDDGNLLLKLDDNSVHTVRAGEVRLTTVE